MTTIDPSTVPEAIRRRMSPEERRRTGLLLPEDGPAPKAAPAAPRSASLGCAVDLPGLRLGRGLNDRKHWTERSKEAKAQRAAVAAVLPVTRPVLPCHVWIVRIAPSDGLDDDNLAGACKHVRDAVAEWLGVEDGRYDPVKWASVQDRGPWGVRIVVLSDVAGATCAGCDRPVVVCGCGR